MRVKKIDRNPDFNRKTVERVSTTTTFRSRPPTNVQTASRAPNMVFDHSKQFAVFPDRLPNSLIEATNSQRGIVGYRTMNRSGRPFALKVDVGGSPDDTSDPWVKGKKTRMLK
jgi:hypothetical protein